MELIAQEKFEVIQKHPKHLSLRHPLRGDSLPEIGAAVIVGSLYTDSIPICLDSIRSIDKRGVIATSGGLRFSSKAYEITSTKKVGDCYLQMFDVDTSYDRLLKSLELQRKENLARMLTKLESAVRRLNPEADAVLINDLLETIDSSKQFNLN